MSIKNTTEVFGGKIHVTEQTGWLINTYTIDPFEKEIKQALIKLGWTPPIEDKEINIPESGWYD